MTALREFQRLEAAGLWRAGTGEQRRDVIVSLGDATLTISDLKDQPLAHWSIVAVIRANPGQYPAVFHPDGDAGETLELSEDEAMMLEAIDKLQTAIEKARPHPGRLRMLGGLSVLAATVALLVFGLPSAMYQQTLSVVPEVQRQSIGQRLLGRVERVAGRACTSPETAPILRALAARTGVERVVILRDGVTESLALPGGIVLLNRSLVEDHEDPAVAAGALVVERARARAEDPLAGILEIGGLRASFRLLTTGDLSREVLDRFVEHSLATERPRLPDEVLLAAFKDASVPSTPYAYAQDVTGETTLGLIEADPMGVPGQPTRGIMSDRDWVQLQNICD
ncbi:hypothetical protein TRM7557_03343 [Tritonibacter multivorans]|uniref:Uncharacterized protein n=1 Tax=Tritonibacter multivorans TaxID=928856 RepID=A0A0P1GH81_9RHOB|nr:hypothetical protein [Tritonibacter multivorans]MDA7420599.1 hypothetical protein [Tritonibacter multivorans]CUH81298.1 hypothetical protein TRM7557_03343 [Tritonibacter multivorans]SFC32460.1 hypothetical protein SAMN04488049_102179 [Tritonibacter multivorans]